MKKILIAIILFSSSFALFGQTKVGSTSAPFLNIGVGPRAVAVGGAFIATADDPTALYWNPAGIAKNRNSGAMFSHSSWFADININWAGAYVNLDNMGTVGLSLTYLDYGKMEVTNNREQDGTGEMFSASDMQAGLTYAYNLTDRFSIGGTVKYIRSTIWNTSASAVAVDLGTLFTSDIYGLRIGATITNFGTDMKLDGKDLLVLYDINSNVNDNSHGNNDQILATLNTDQFALPLTFKVGVAMDLFNNSLHKFSVGADAVHPSDNAESINVGAEYVFQNLISFRGGYNSLGLKNSQAGVSFGVGLQYEFDPGYGVFVDYAYQDYNVLKNTQHFSIGVRF